MPFGLPAIGETNWGQKILDSINAVKDTADEASVAVTGVVNLASLLSATRTPGTTDDTAAFVAAIADGRPIYVPEGDYRITSGLTFPADHPGMRGAGIHETNIYAEVPASATALTVDDGHGTYEGFSLYAGAVGDTDAARRAVARHGIHFDLYGGHGRFADLFVYGFNGFGMKFTAVWDSMVENVIVEKCGNTTEWAFQVLSGTDTSNHTVFNRVQVEVAYDKAMYVAPTSVNLVFLGIHSERLVRTTSTSADVSHGLGGASCTYENIRVGNADATVSRVEFNAPSSAVRQFRTSGTVDVNIACTAAGEKLRLEGCTLGAVSFDFNAGWVTFADCSFGTVTVTDQGERVAFVDCYHNGNVVQSGNGTASRFLRCYFATGCTITESAGNPEVYAYACNFDTGVSGSLVRLHGCRFRSAANFDRINGDFKVHDTYFLGNLNIGANGCILYAHDCEVDGNLGVVWGSPLGRFQGGSVSGTVHPAWTAAPEVRLLTSAAWNPAVVTQVTTASTTFVDVDAALSVTFTAPDSGKVLVTLNANAGVSTATAQGYWNLRDSGGDVAGTSRGVSAAATVDTRTVPILVTGLTPGQSYTWKWGHRIHNSSYTTLFNAGGDTGPATMFVHSA